MNRATNCAKLSALSLAFVTAYAQANTAELDEVVVKASAYNNGYSAIGSLGITGMPMTLRETPQSVTVISAQQIQDQHLKTAREALKQANGVFVTEMGTGRTGPKIFYVRGNEVNNHLIDGLPQGDSFGDSALMHSNAKQYDRIEVLRGASALMTGTGQPSAVINMVPKRPTKERQAEVGLSAGNWDYYGVNGDFSGALNDTGSVRGRLLFDAYKAHGQEKRVKNHDTMLLAAIEADLSDKTRLNIATTLEQFQEKGGARHKFVPYDANGNPTTFGRKDNSGARWNKIRDRNLYLNAGVEHQFNDHWQMDLKYIYAKSKDYSQIGVAADMINADRSSEATAAYNQAQSAQHSFSLNLNGRYMLFGRQHDLMFGASGYHRNGDSPEYKWQNPSVANIDEFARSGELVQPTPIYSHNSIRRTGHRGAYLATRFYPIDKLALIVGSRFSRETQKTTPWSSTQLLQVTNSKLTPYFGVVYDLNDNLSAYGSYTSMFKPQANRYKDGTYLQPETGKNVEFGLKGEFFDGNLNTAFALFETRKDNYAEWEGSDEINGAYYTALDGTKSRGFEFEMGGKINENWLIQAGYSYSKRKDKNGKTLDSDLPRQQAKLFTSYHLNNWTVGGGVRWQSTIYGTKLFYLGYDLSENELAAAEKRALPTLRQKGYLLADAMVRYDFNKQASFTLNVNNLFDKTYRSDIYQRAYGLGRHFIGTFSYKF